MKKEPRTHSKGVPRVEIGILVTILIVSLLLLTVVANYFGFKYYKRWDLSRDKKYALSDKPQRFLQSINGKVRATIFFSPDNPLASDVQTLLTEYQYAGKGKIDVEILDPNR